MPGKARRRLRRLIRRKHFLLILVRGRGAGACFLTREGTKQARQRPGGGQLCGLASFVGICHSMAWDIGRHCHSEHLAGTRREGRAAELGVRADLERRPAAGGRGVQGEVLHSSSYYSGCCGMGGNGSHQ